jgi:hypothetical protein
MTEKNRVVIETGSKKVFASAIDWPGWSRSGKTGEAALTALTDYAGRYEKVAAIAGESGVTDAAATWDVIEHLEGSGATDFGVPDKVTECDRESMTAAECERQIRILRACWQYFDETAERVSEELQKGPRGGGRNRAAIVEHVYGADRGYARRIGVKTPADVELTHDGLRAHRDAVCDAILQVNEAEHAGTSWPPRYFIRRAAWHLLDHAWEMEDKDLTGRG